MRTISRMVARAACLGSGHEITTRCGRDAFDTYQHAIEIDWIREVFVEAAGERALAVVVAGVAGNRNERYIREARDSTEVAGKLVTIHRGKPDVEERNVGNEAFDELQRARTVARD